MREYIVGFLRGTSIWLYGLYATKNTIYLEGPLRTPQVFAADLSLISGAIGALFLFSNEIKNVGYLKYVFHYFFIFHFASNIMIQHDLLIKMIPRLL